MLRINRSGACCHRLLERSRDRQRPCIDLLPVASVAQLGRKAARHLLADEAGVVCNASAEHHVVMRADVGRDALDVLRSGPAFDLLRIALVLTDRAAAEQPDIALAQLGAAQQAQGLVTPASGVDGTLRRFEV